MAIDESLLLSVFPHTNWRGQGDDQASAHDPGLCHGVLAGQCVWSGLKLVRTEHGHWPIRCIADGAVLFGSTDSV